MSKIQNKKRSSKEAEESAQFLYAANLLNQAMDEYALKRLEEAKQKLLKAIKVRYNFAPALSILGGILLEQEDFHGAIEAFEKAIRHNKYIIFSYSGLVATYLGMGMLQKAKETLENGGQILKSDEYAKYQEEQKDVENDVYNSQYINQSNLRGLNPISKLNEQAEGELKRIEATIAENITKNNVEYPVGLEGIPRNKDFIKQGVGSVGGSVRTIMKVYKNIKENLPADANEEIIFHMTLKARREHVKKFGAVGNPLYEQDEVIMKDVKSANGDLFKLIFNEIEYEYPILKEVAINSPEVYELTQQVVREVIEEESN